MENNAISTILLVATCGITYKGLSNKQYFEKYCFEIDKILIAKEYYRLFSSGFLHVGWIHLALNMSVLVSFGFMENSVGYGNFLLIYLAGLTGGNLLSLYIHRNHGEYRAVGASGAVSAVIFSLIVMVPDSSISFLFLPFHIKGWIFGCLFILLSILGVKKNRDRIGHDAHLGGAITGVLCMLCIKPELAYENWWVVLLILIPFGLFFILIVRNPAVLLIENYWGNPAQDLGAFSVPFKNKEVYPEEEIDKLLDKINQKGIDKLTKKEKKRLEELKGRL